jgi:hypothetical protein
MIAGYSRRGVEARRGLRNKQLDMRCGETRGREEGRGSLLGKAEPTEVFLLKTFLKFI